MHYAVVHFELIILDGQDGYIGKFNTLRLVEHASCAVFRGAIHSFLMMNSSLPRLYEPESILLTAVIVITRLSINLLYLLNHSICYLYCNYRTTSRAVLAQ